MEELEIARADFRSPAPSPQQPESPGGSDELHSPVSTPTATEQPEPSSSPSPHPTGSQRAYPALPRTAAPNRRQRVAQSNKKTAAHLKVASENIKGRGSARIAGNEKWRKLADSIVKDRIGIIALQESHLSADHVDEIHSYYNHLHVVNSPLPENPTGAGGVALVFNKRLTNTEGIQSHVLVPGRALLATFNWHRDDELTVLAIYAPTDREENRELWDRIEDKIRSSQGRIPKPDILLGDLNFVEDAIDRFPAHLSRIDAPDSFDSLKRYLSLQDGWRDANPDRIEWSWRNAARTALSRIDRIYVTRTLLLASRSWDITISGLNKDDHSRVSVEIMNIAAPDVGTGRWTMSEALTQDEQFLEEVERIGSASLARMRQLKEQPRSDDRNVQVEWKDFKQAVTRQAKHRQREINCAKLSRLKLAQEERRQASSALTGAATEDERENARRALATAETHVHQELDNARSHNLAHRTARARLEGETMTKCWFNWAKDKRPRDTILSLRKPNDEPHAVETNSRRMADMAGDYHDSIQLKDIDVDAPTREEATREVLEHIALKADEETRESLSKHVCEEDIAESLKAAKNGSAAGIDGLIYELWKTLHRRHEKSLGQERECFNIVEMMTMVFVDIESHGVAPETRFTDGWLCPIYKKGDRSDVANYRPITLLNTDYKLYTKALALKLALAAPSLIHKSQAGFVRGRSITDQTKLTSLILNYAEATEENGVIVALDQEKAYDRIRHDYLIRVLKAYELPDLFINSVKSLYDDAHTSVMINGFLGKAFKVTRGVRQGDPLSCLLFNLAIEPLAAMLRNSELQGYQIPGLTEKLIASLYADDTTVFLSEHDSYELLQSILEQWCLASGAKFNTQKTELIPMGAPEYRDSLRTTRQLGDADQFIPGTVRIAADGETTRILGSWPGNGVGNHNAWSTILDRVERDLRKWEKHHPTLNGKSILSQTIAGGYTQYLTAAEGMPLVVQKKLDKIVLDFFWEGTGRHPINMEVLRRPKDYGGLNLFSAEERNDAQYVVWVGAYIAPPDERPLWAFLADEIFRRAIRVADKARIPAESRINPFCQDWRPNRNKLPFILKQMLRVADKYNLVPDAPYIPQDIRKATTAWAHPAVLDQHNMFRSTPETRCLRKHHAVRTLDDLEEIAEQDLEDHTGEDDCECENCEDDRAEGCRHPNRCQEYANDLLGSIAPKWNLATEQLDEERDIWDALLDGRKDAVDNGESVAFDQRERAGKEVSDLYRIFVNSHALAPAERPEILRREAGVREPVQQGLDSIHVIACGSTIHGRTADAVGGFAVHFEGGEHENQTGRCPGEHQTQERSAAAAILAAAQSVHPGQTLHIITNSKNVVKRLTTQLRRHEDAGWLETPEAADVLRAAAAALRKRGAETTLTYVGKRRLADWPEVRETTRKARAAARAELPAALPVAGLELYDRPGLKARGITQRQALRAIKLAKIKDGSERRATTRGVEKVRNYARAASGRAPTTEQIWRATRDRDISRNVRNWQWKGIHGAHKVGRYFRGMPSPWKEHEICPSCGVSESMEHILTQCPDSAQETIWELAGEFLEEKIEWSKPTIGGVWGCALANFQNEDGLPDKGLNRAYRIVVSESAFLAWKIRCEKRIEHADEPDWAITAAEAQRRWYKVINQRIAHDRLLTSRKRYKRRAIKLDTVLETWDGLIEGVDELTAEILRQPGVLVGTGTSRYARGEG